MKHASWVVILAMLAVSGIAAAQTIGTSTIVAKVPFEFVVANRIVPAGEYKVQAATMDGRSLVIRNVGAKIGLFSSISKTEDKEIASNYALVFSRYGNSYFLSGIKMEGSNVTYQLLPSKAEAELRAHNQPVQVETLLAARE
jgi:hypothetical protein